MASRKRPYYDEPYSDYDPNVDYQALINENVAAGDYEKAAINEAYRRSKIEGEGLDYEPTHLYDKYLNPAGNAPNSAQSYMAQLYSSIPQYQDIPQYGGSWGDDEYRRLLEQAIGMNYSDWTQGSDYAALANRYSQQGQRAMQDTLAQISARTGGLASSYAGTAAQGQYNNYMQMLEQAARSQYASDRGDIIQNAGLAQQYGQQDYERWLNDVQMRRQGMNDANALLSELYGYATQADETDYARKQDAQNFIYNWLLSGHDIGGLPADIITASGLTSDILNNWAAEGQKALLQSQSGGGGGGRTGGTGGEEQTLNDIIDTLYQDAYESGNPELYIRNSYKQYGLTGVNDLVKGYANWVGPYEWGQTVNGFDVGTGGVPLSSNYTDAEVATSQPNPANAVGAISSYDNAVNVLRQYGATSAQINSVLTESTWNKRKADTDSRQKDPAVRYYDTYLDYLRDYVRYILEV